MGDTMELTTRYWIAKLGLIGLLFLGGLGCFCGSCVEDGDAPEGAACQYNAQCADELICHDDRCRPPLEKGATCRVDSDCQNDLACVAAEVGYECGAPVVDETPSGSGAGSELVEEGVEELFF
jgi:hypothetical protein